MSNGLFEYRPRLSVIILGVSWLLPVPSVVSGCAVDAPAVLGPDSDGSKEGKEDDANGGAAEVLESGAQDLIPGLPILEMRTSPADEAGDTCGDAVLESVSQGSELPLGHCERVAWPDVDGFPGSPPEFVELRVLRNSTGDAVENVGVVIPPLVIAVLRIAATSAPVAAVVAQSSLDDRLGEALGWLADHAPPLVVAPGLVLSLRIADIFRVRSREGEFEDENPCDEWLSSRELDVPAGRMGMPWRPRRYFVYACYGVRQGFPVFEVMPRDITIPLWGRTDIEFHYFTSPASLARTSKVVLTATHDAQPIEDETDIRFGAPYVAELKGPGYLWWVEMRAKAAATSRGPLRGGGTYFFHLRVEDAAQTDAWGLPAKTVEVHLPLIRTR